MTAAVRLRLGLGLVAIVAMCSHVRGDGVIIKKSGQYLAEKDQQAFIEWERGHETLYVATGAESAV